MFKISPVQDINTAEIYAKACGIQLKDGCFLYAMTDIESSEIMGVCQFEIYGDHGYIYDLRPRIMLDDFEAMFILGRQTMNFINLCGANECRATCDAADEKLISAIGFKKLNDYYTCNMSGMFDGSHCSGHKK